ncbi:TPA: hypothetical protein ACH3X1_001050 [Trebouxia sp. C0004]
MPAAFRAAASPPAPHARGPAVPSSCGYQGEAAACTPADADRSVQQVSKPDAAASLDVTLSQVDTAAVAELSAQLSYVSISAANGTTEATGGDEPAAILQSNTEGTGGVLLTTPAVEVQQAAQQQLLLPHLASAGTLDTMPDMPSYNGSKQQDAHAHTLSAQPIQLSVSDVLADTTAADSLVDAALREDPSLTASLRQKEIVERPIAGDLSSPDVEVIMGPEDTIPSRVTEPKSFPAQPDDVLASMLPPSAAAPSLEGSALVPGIADAAKQESTESDEDSLHAMHGR